jgi:hypothetical protein
MMEALRATLDGSGVDADRAGDVLRQWYREGVKPLLRHAWVDDRFVTSALRQCFDWMGNAAILGLSDVTEETDAEAFALMEDCLRSAIRRAGLRMAETNDPDFLLDVLRWVEYAQFIGITSLTLDDAVAATPLRVVIEDVRLSGAPAAGEQAEVTVVARVRIGDGSPLPRIVTVDVGASGGDVDPSSGTANHAGEFATRVSRDDSGGSLVVTATTSFAPLAPFAQVVLTDTRSLTID